MKYILILVSAVVLQACIQNVQSQQPDFYFGADLSYVNELQDCGASYRQNGQTADPYQLFAKEGTNLVRLRLWHSPSWTKYSTLADIKKSITRAKDAKMKVLLDFHYSDNWADPAHQIIPKAWAQITDQNILGDSVYTYTYATLSSLKQADLLPDLVQIGNETNSEVMMHKPTKDNGPTNWQRNAYLLSKGLMAVKDFNKENGLEIGTMLHVAQPENARDWFAQAAAHNLNEFQWIGLSYYPNWSKFNLAKLQEEISYLRGKYQKNVMVVETGYPFSTDNFDAAGNVLGNQAALAGYPVSKEGQLSFMVDLVSTVKKAGGIGVVYWEPAWVSSTCKTQWGTGSHWENATFFDPSKNNEVLPAIKYMKLKY